MNERIRGRKKEEKGKENEGERTEGLMTMRHNMGLEIDHMN